jgi:hypothetical protein
MFENAELKVRRAIKHIDDFHAKDREFFAADACSLTFITDPKIGKSWFQFRQHNPIPPEFALIIGDAIHNLHSALDQLIWEVVSPLGPLQPDRVQFPFCKKADSFESVIRMREIHLAGEKIVKAIRESEPYPDGNGELFLLHALDVADKHKLVIGMQSLIAPSGFEDKEMERDLAHVVANLQQVVIVPGDDGKIGEVPYVPHLTRRHRRSVPGLHKALREKREKKLTAKFTSAFGRGQPFGGRPVLSILLRLVERVTEVMNGVSAAIEGGD